MERNKEINKKKEKEFSTKTQFSRNRNEKLNLISELDTDEYKKVGEKSISIKNNEIISNKNMIQTEDNYSNKQESLNKAQSLLSISTNQRELKNIIVTSNSHFIRNFEYENEREKTTSRNRLNSNIPNYGSFEEENIPFGICFICDKYNQRSQTYSTGKCMHFFCRRCGKLFYEEQIEDGIIKFKCPIFFCKCEMPIEIIKKLVSEKHYNIICDNNIKKNNIYKYRNWNYINSENVELNNHIHLYSQTHVIDINSNEHFYMYNKAKINICPKCNKNSLFIKGGNHFFKCLNCFYTMCKFCLKNFDSLHLDITNSNHCKVFFRRKDQKNIKNNCVFSFINQLFLIIASYILLFIGLYFYIFNFFQMCFTCNNKKYFNNCFLYFIICFLSVIFLLIFSPFLFLFIPYFPIFNEIFG